MTARPTHHRKNVFKIFGDVAICSRTPLANFAHEIDDVVPLDLMDTLGAPSRDDVVTQPAGDTEPDRRSGNRSKMYVATSPSTRSTMRRRFEFAFSAAGSRPSRRAANIF